MLDFWQRTKSLIKARNTKQQAIAEQTGISILTLRGWITHDRLPDVVSAYKIAQALGTTVEYLVTGKQPQQDHRETKELAAEILRLLSPYLGEQDL